jgi:hypothetical protein
MILNKLNKANRKIYARKTNIQLVEYDIAQKFLNENHIQGGTPFKIAIGLYNNDELVSLMCFGRNKKENNTDITLVRFCSLLNTNVIGGASKLFKYFLNNFSYSNIISFADASFFGGSMYEILGFKCINDKKIVLNYWWAVDGIRKHRFTYCKQKLVKMGYDKDKSEVQIMNDLGYYRIWGCGLKKYVYIK